MSENYKVLKSMKIKQGDETVEAHIIDDSKVGEAAWSGLNSIEKLCPSFSESGMRVQCEPVEGYPLTVTVKEDATTITRCGKNLINYKEAYPRAKNDGTVIGKVDVESIDNGVSWYEGNYYLGFPCNIRAEETVVFSCEGTTNNIAYVTLFNRAAQKACSGQISIGDSMKATADADAFYIYKVNPEGFIEDDLETPIVLTKLQLEYGSVPTSYEPYRSKAFLPGEAVPALSGINTIWADSGEITVTGKADPVAIIEKLTQAFSSLGSNV